MAVLRSAFKSPGSGDASEASNNNDSKQGGVKSGPPSPSSSSSSSAPMTTVIFFALLIDLLAFTLILPLLPALLDHYRKNDGEGGLYHFLESKVREAGNCRSYTMNEYIHLLSNFSPSVLLGPDIPAGRWRT